MYLCVYTAVNLKNRFRFGLFIMDIKTSKATN
jgi:hypothetical protein